MSHDELLTAFREYQEMCYQARAACIAGSDLLAGNLQRYGIKPGVLTILKRELQDWNSAKCRWRRPLD